MTKKYGTINYKTDYTKFGGIIYPSDYSTDYRGKNNTNGSPIAARIMKDKNFDIQCGKILKKDKKEKENKNV